MATQNLSAEATKSNTLPDWKKERIELANLIRESILDPIMNFAEMVRYYDEKQAGPLETDMTAAILRLLVIGGYTDLKLCCADGITLYSTGDCVDKTIKKWESAPEEAE
jgi:hypothetical protein